MHDHAEQTRKACMAHLERKTRFETEDLTLAQTQSEKVHLDILAKAEIVYNVKRDTVPGRVNAGVHDVAVHSHSERDAQIRARVDKATSRPGLLAEAKQRFTHLHPANLPRQTLLETLSGQVVYNYPCGSCSGQGRVTCSGCNGYGNVAHGQCGGTGYVTRTVTRTRQAGGRQVTTTDRVREPCHCGNGRETCGRCGGSGTVACQPCNASGQLTDLSTISLDLQISTSFREIRCDLPKLKERLPGALGPQQAAAESELIEREWRDVNRIATNGYFSLSSMASTIGLQFDDTVVSPMAFGTTPVLLHLDGLVTRFVAEDLETLGEVSGRGTPKAARQQALADFMESEIHQDMVARATGSRSSRTISHDLQGALEPDYIRRSLAELETAASNHRKQVSAQSWYIFSALAGGAVAGVFALAANSEASGGALVALGCFALLLIYAIGNFSANALGERRLRLAGGDRLKKFALGKRQRLWWPAHGLLEAVFNVAAALAGFFATVFLIASYLAS